jgi:hypothetical protein
MKAFGARKLRGDVPAGRRKKRRHNFIFATARQFGVPAQNKNPGPWPGVLQASAVRAGNRFVTTD